MRTIKTILSTSLLCAALGVHAESPWSVGLNYASGLDGLQALTGSRTGLNVDLGYQGIIGETKIPFRASLGVLQFQGSGPMPVRHMVLDDNGDNRPFTVPVPADRKLTALQLAGDVYLPTPAKGLFVITGVSLNKWHSSNPWLSLGTDSVTPDGKASTPELKIGLRMGLAYEFTPRIAGTLRYQWSEFGSIWGLNDQDPDHPGKSILDRKANPAWIDLGVTVRF